MKLASFDIFDTALIRRCGKPENIFYLMAERLYPGEEEKKDLFFWWRKSVEAKVKSKLNREVTLNDLYEDEEIFAFVEYSPEYICALEKMVEAENLVYNPQIKEIISRKREEGCTIAFISDMYLDEDLLREILVREGCFLNGDYVFVSATRGGRKSTGALYDYVRRELKPLQWVHYGDNRHSDVVMAKRKGIEAVAVDSSFNKVETTILSVAEKQREKQNLSLLSSYSRTLRIGAKENIYSSFAADFVAPTYVAYIKYIEDYIKRKGHKRVYFLSRDSYVLMKGMESIENLDAELRYLFVSRKSLLLPYLIETTAEHYLKVIDKHTVYRKHVDVLLDKLGFSREDLKSCGVEFAYNHIATREQEADFLNKLFNSDFTSLLHERAVAEYALLLKYFEQEKLFEEGALLVDVGWLGTSRLMINYILQREGKRAQEFAYFGVRNDVFLRSAGDFVSFFKHGQLASDATILLENYFSSSPYPTTIGYCENADGNILPVFPEGETFCETEITKANVSVIQEFIKLLNGADFITTNDYFVWANETLKTLLELKVDMNLTALLHCAEFDNRPFVRKLTLKELFLLICCGKHITSLDKMSLYLTLGKRWRRLFIEAYSFVHNIKRKIFLRFIFR